MPFYHCSQYLLYVNVAVMCGLVLLLLGIRECAICGALATYECKNCFREFGDGLDKISFCDICLTKVAILLLAE